MQLTRLTIDLNQTLNNYNVFVPRICPLVSNTSLDLSEADDRVQKQGIPFVGHVQYVTMMLFAGLGTHPETTEPEVKLS